MCNSQINYLKLKYWHACGELLLILYIGLVLYTLLSSICSTAGLVLFYYTIKQKNSIGLHVICFCYKQPSNQGEASEKSVGGYLLEKYQTYSTLSWVIPRLVECKVAS